MHMDPHALNDPNTHFGLLDDNQIPVNIMRRDAHQNDPHTMMIDGRDVSNDGLKLDTIQSGAQVNNLTDQQANSLISGSHSAWHTHDDWYYRKSQLQISGQSSIHWDNISSKPTTFTPSTHDHNILYYTKTESDNKYSIINHTHIEHYTKIESDSKYSIIDHTHVEYYTQIELNALLLNKSDVGHLHDDRYYTEIESDGRYYTQIQLNNGQLDSRYYTESEVDQLVTAAASGISGAVDTFDLLPLSSTMGDIYIVKQTVGLNEEGFYRWNGTNWAFLYNNTGTSLHNQLSDLNEGDFKHLTNVQYLDLTNGSDSSLHKHDNLYNTKLEITNLLLNKSDVGHLHDDRYYTEIESDGRYSAINHLHNDYYTKIYIDGTYYTKTELDNGQLNSLYNTKLEIIGLLSGKSDLTHSHNDYYLKIETYNKIEIDLLYSGYYTKTELDNGQLNNLYYTQTQLNNGQLDSRYYTESEITNSYYSRIQLDGGQLDSRYYTESELGINGAQKIGITEITNITSSNVQGALEEIYAAVSSSFSSLQEAYTKGSDITISASPVKITSTNTNAPLELTNKTTTPTTNLSAGQICVIDNELYIYDGGRLKWLTPSKTLLFGKSGNADGTTLRPVGDSSSLSTGYRMSKNGCILGVTINSTSNINKLAYIVINITQAHIINIVNGQLNLNNLNINFNANDVVSIYIDPSGSAITESTCVLEFSWRK